MTDEEIMRDLIRYGYEKMEKNRAYPFCAYVVRNGVIISKGYNYKVNAYGDITSHGEMEALSKASKSLQLKDLIFGREYELFSTCEPCLACFDTALWHRLGRIVYSADHNDFPEYFHSHPYSIEDFVRQNPGYIEVKSGVMRKEAVALFTKAKEKYGW